MLLVEMPASELSKFNHHPRQVLRFFLKNGTPAAYFLGLALGMQAIEKAGNVLKLFLNTRNSFSEQIP